MGDRVKFSVHCTPIESVAVDQGSAQDVLATEVGTSLGGSGESINLTGYAGALNEQGYKDGAVGYLDCVHTAGGVRLTQRNNGDFFHIRNTGFVYSSATVLGASTTDCVMVALRIKAWDTGANDGWYGGQGETDLHFIEIAWLKPGEAFHLPVAGNNLNANINETFGANAGDLTYMNENDGGSNETVLLYAKTIKADGTAATDGVAVEFLSVD